MRNFEDCKAEVFRRSEERIKERKRTRNRVMACCIPVCLLLVAGGLYIRPLLEPVDEMGRKSEEDCAIPEREPGGVADDVLSGSTAYISVEVIDKTGETERVREIAGTKRADKLCRFMDSFFSMTPATNTSIADGTEKESMLDTPTTDYIDKDCDTILDGMEIKCGSEEQAVNYKLVFKKSTGMQFVFLLHENCLYNEMNGCEVELSDEQLSELMTLIE